MKSILYLLLTKIFWPYKSSLSCLILVSFSQLSAESEQSKVNGKWRYWLEHWVDTQLAKRDDLQNIGTREEFESQKVKLRNLKGKDASTYLPRTTHHRKQRSIGEEHSISMTGSPLCPTYMAATQSARAKSRSLSSPRLRPISLDSWSATNSPYKHKLLSPISSINSDASISRVRNVNGGGGFSQRSPSLKGVPGHVKSNRTSKHHSFTSESSMLKWDQIGHFRWSYATIILIFIYYILPGNAWTMNQLLYYTYFLHLLWKQS